MVSPSSSSPPSPPTKGIEIGMGFDSSPPISISPAIFGFLKSLNLKSVGKGLDDVPPVLGRELVVYDPVVAESRTMRKGLEGGCTVDVEHVMEDPFLNDDPIKDTANIDSDESNSILWIKRTTQTIPQTASRPAEWVPNSGLKTIVSKPSTTSTRLPQTRSSGPPKSFPLLEDVIKHPAKKSATKSAKKPTTSPLQKTKKPTKKREALKPVSYTHLTLPTNREV